MPATYQLSLVVVSYLIAAPARTLNTAKRLGLELGLQIKGVISKPFRVADLRGMLEGLRHKSIVVTKESLDEAIRQNQLFLVYLPKLDFKSSRIVGAEALIHWHAERRGSLPDSFIPAIERTLSDSLTTWMLDRAIKQAGARHKVDTNLQLAVNVSALNLHDLTLPERIRAGLPTGGRGAGFAHPRAHRDGDHERRREDVGYSGALPGEKLQALHRRLRNRLLVQFQRCGPPNSRSTSRSSCRCTPVVIAHAIADLAHNLGLSVVAEGLENEIALSMLSERSCDAAQGYFISRSGEGPVASEFASNWKSPASPCAELTADRAVLLVVSSGAAVDGGDGRNNLCERHPRKRGRRR